MHETNDWAEHIGNIAHDLKTPIAAVMQAIDFIQNAGPLTDQQMYFSDRALVTLGQMAQMVASLLEQIRIDANRPLERRACDVNALVAKSVDTLNAFAKQREVTFHVETDPQLGSIDADEDRLEPVLMNLLSNAVKYNRHPGEVFVRTRGFDDHVELVVQDTGVGIPEEDLPNIFERFYRVQVKRGEAVNGTGLGLAIVKANVEKHGGRVWVESVLDEGSTFGFSLPRTAPDEARNDVTPARSRTRGYREAGSEQSDSVDDNLQEPPSTHDDDHETSASSGLL